MNFVGKKLKLKKILLTLSLSAFGCASMPDIKPHVLDTQLKEMREYKIVDRENIIIEYVTNHPMQWGKNTYGNGFYCLSPEDAAALKQWAMEKKTQSQLLEQVR